MDTQEHPTRPRGLTSSGVAARASANLQGTGEVPPWKFFLFASLVIGATGAVASFRGEAFDALVAGMTFLAAVEGTLCYLASVAECDRGQTRVLVLAVISAFCSGLIGGTCRDLLTILTPPFWFASAFYLPLALSGGAVALLLARYLPAWSTGVATAAGPLGISVLASFGSAKVLALAPHFLHNFQPIVMVVAMLGGVITAVGGGLVFKKLCRRPLELSNEDVGLAMLCASLPLVLPVGEMAARLSMLLSLAIGIIVAAARLRAQDDGAAPTGAVVHRVQRIALDDQHQVHGATADDPSDGRAPVNCQEGLPAVAAE